MVGWSMVGAIMELIDSIRRAAKRAVISFEHQLVSIALDDAIRSDNKRRVSDLTARECCLRAELRPLGGPVRDPRDDDDENGHDDDGKVSSANSKGLLDDYELVESQAWLGEPGAFRP